MERKTFSFIFYSVKQTGLIIFDFFSILSKEIIEETVSEEFKLLKEICLDTVLWGKDSTNTVIQNHVESIICSSDYTEVSIIYINLD